jgi:ribosomal protein L4
LSARNIQKAGVVLSSDMNTYNILNTSVILLTEDALADIENNLKD